MPAWVKIVRKVDPFILGWLGMVKGVRLPSVFSRIIAIWFAFRTSRNPRFSNAMITLFTEASTGNLVINNNSRFSQKSLQHRLLVVECFFSETLNVK